MKLASLDNQRGYMIILTMIIVFVLMGTGLTIASTVSANYASTKRATYVDSAVSTAEAGVSATISELSRNPGFTGFPDTDGDRQEFYNNVQQGKAEYGTTVISNANNTKTIRSNGYVYAINTSTTGIDATNKKSVEAVVAPKEVNITPSIFAGPGGLYMTASQGPSNNVYVMGKMRMGNHAALGTSTSPVNLQVAGLGCSPQYSGPVSSCAAGGDPAVVEWSADLYGSVCATGKTDSTGITPASGLAVGCTASPMAMPYFDKGNFTSGMTNPPRTGLSDSCGFGLPSSATLKDKTRYTGDLSVDFYCNAMIEGDVYIEGDFVLGYSAELQVRNGLATPPTIVVNGRVDLGGKILANSSGQSVRIISFKSSDAACSTSPICTSIDDANMKSSMSIEGVKCVFCNVDGATLWAYFSEAHINGPRMTPARVGALIGNHVDIRGYDYGSNSWTPTPPGSVKMIAGYNLISYRQIY